MRADDAIETGFSSAGFFGDTGRGHIDITIKGGTIGNDYENVIPNKSDDVAAGITSDKEVANWTSDDWTKWKKYSWVT